MMDLSIESEIKKQIEEYKDRRGKLPDNIIISRAVKELDEMRNPYKMQPIHPYTQGMKWFINLY